MENANFVKVSQKKKCKNCRKITTFTKKSQKIRKLYQRIAKTRFPSKHPEKTAIFVRGSREKTQFHHIITKKWKFSRKKTRNPSNDGDLNTEN